MDTLSEFLTSSKCTKRPDDQYKDYKDPDFFKEQKAPERSLEYMRKLCEELDQVFCPRASTDMEDEPRASGSGAQRKRPIISDSSEGGNDEASTRNRPMTSSSSSSGKSRREPDVPSPRKRFRTKSPEASSTPKTTKKDRDSRKKRYYHLSLTDESMRKH